MKHTLYLLPAIALALSLTSCIKDEPLNAECDITAVETSWVEAHKAILVGNPIITNDHVSFTLQKGSDRTAMDPRFTLTEGATITMLDEHNDAVEANGVTRDFSMPQTYTTHSQDGQWSKNYTVSFNYPTAISSLSFEHFELDNTKRYQEWYEVDSLDTTNPKREYWSTGNPGYAITGKGKDPSLYPTVSDPLGVSGNCVKLTTCGTGSFGDLVGMPIAAGSIFIGTFDTKIAMKRPREATAFGLQLVSRKPTTLEGYYKYTEGEIFTDKDKKVCPERHDTADIYAVVYELPYDENGIAQLEPLNGDEVLSSDRIVMLARIADPGQPSTWKHFSEPFVLQPGKTWSEERLNRDGYAISVVATSSRQGAYFEGSIGSTLWVDELKVNWEE